MRQVGRFTVFVLAVLAAAAPGLVWAHATLVSSDPADGAHLDRAPGEATLTFDVDVKIVALTLHGTGTADRPLTPAGAAVDEGPGLTSATRSVKVLLPSLAPGSYRLEWRAMSRDSHPASGSVAFTVQEGTPAPPR